MLFFFFSRGCQKKAKFPMASAPKPRFRGKGQNQPPKFQDKNKAPSLNTPKTFQKKSNPPQARPVSTDQVKFSAEGLWFENVKTLPQIKSDSTKMDPKVVFEKKKRAQELYDKLADSFNTSLFQFFLFSSPLCLCFSLF